jgi:hypothetical protein
VGNGFEWWRKVLVVFAAREAARMFVRMSAGFVKEGGEVD